MPVNWKDPKAFTRLLAAMVAAQDMKLNYHKIASMYGNGATYDSIEGRFRIIRTEAAALKAEVDSGERSEAPARGTTLATPRKPRSTANTPKKDKTVGGRVSKSNNGTPSKKRGKPIKEELEEISSASFAGLLDIEDETFPAVDFKNSPASAEGADGTELFSDTHFAAVMRDMDAEANASMDFDAV